MKIANVDNKYKEPTFQALMISAEAIQPIKEKGQEVVNRLIKAGKEFENYKHYNLKIVGEKPSLIIESQDASIVYKDFFRPVLPYGDALNISTWFGTGKNQGKLAQFSIQYLNKSQAFRAYKTVYNDENKDMIDYAVAITRLLEQEAVAKEAVAKETDAQGLLAYLDRSL